MKGTHNTLGISLRHSMIDSAKKVLWFIHSQHRQEQLTVIECGFRIPDRQKKMRVPAANFYFPQISLSPPPPLFIVSDLSIATFFSLIVGNSVSLKSLIFLLFDAETVFDFNCPYSYCKERFGARKFHLHFIYLFTDLLHHISSIIISMFPLL